MVQISSTLALLTNKPFAAKALINGGYQPKVEPLQTYPNLGYIGCLEGGGGGINLSIGCQ